MQSPRNIRFFYLIYVNISFFKQLLKFNRLLRYKWYRFWAIIIFNLQLSNTGNTSVQGLDLLQGCGTINIRNIANIKSQPAIIKVGFRNKWEVSILLEGCRKGERMGVKRERRIKAY